MLRRTTALGVLPNFVLPVLMSVLLFSGCASRGNPGSFGAPENSVGETKKKETPAIRIERLLAGHDMDRDGTDDLEDIVEGARAEVERAPRYVDAYYRGGYPPETEGVCTDVIWRAFKNAGYDLKQMVDADIRLNKAAYPRVEGRPDPNIDFRRVPNLVSFFKRHAESLPVEVVPGRADNLVKWQGGDIVVYGAPLWHIGIVSDKRRSDGVPFLIHNSGPVPAENDMLLDWPSPMLYHFRYPDASKTASAP